jgi:hypothetical protein
VVLICQVKFLNLDWWFRAGNGDTCIAESCCHLPISAIPVLIQRQNAVYLYSIEEVFGFFETLPAFETLATLVLRAIKPLLKNPKSIFNSV